MNKKIKLFFILLLALSWYTAISTYFGTPKEYQEHLKQAEKFEKKEIYEDAIAEYEAAQGLLQERSQELDRKIAQDYLQMGEDNDYETTMTTIINTYEDNGETVIELAEYYEKQGQIAKAVNLLREQKEKNSKDKGIVEKLESLKGTYTSVYSSYTEMSRIMNGYSIVKGEFGYGVVNSNGDSLITAEYENAGIFGSRIPYAPVLKNGKWYYINTDIHKKLVPDQTYELLFTFSEAKALACRDGKYGYLDEEMQEVCDFIYEDATMFYNEVAAVKKDGKWAIVNYQFKKITDFVFDDVVMDEYRFCSIGERIFVKENGCYYLIDTKGKRVSDQKFENAYSFVTEEYAAVAQNAKWGFVDRDGKIQIDYQYKDAKSFSIEFAPVKIGDEWGYIDLENKLVIPCKFEDATPFYQDGTAAVRVSDQWSMIKLNIYQ